jgi:hypothetical protein
MSRATANALSASGAVLLVLSVFLLNDKLAYPGAWALMPTVGTFLLIAAGPGAWLNRHVLAQPIAVGIGLISYPLYLWHWPLLSFASINAHGVPPFGVRVAAVLASFALATATYVLIEKPIRFGAKRRFRVPALLGLLLVIGIAGFAIWRRDGVPSRFPEEVRALADFKYEYKTDARYPDCWLSGAAAPDAFAPFCADATAGRPRVVVWGDSHAARLYPGLKAVFGDAVAFSQFTRDACAPILGFGGATCQQSNAWILAEIARLRPDAVILFGVWDHYQKDWASEGAKSALYKTLDALDDAGAGKIVFVGPSPLWRGGLPKLLFEAWTNSRPLHAIPERLATGLEPAIAIVDEKLKSDLAGRDVTYFSVRDFFCNDAGCLTHAPEGVGHLVTWDYGHLTTDGATLVARGLAADQVLP